MPHPVRVARPHDIESRILRFHKEERKEETGLQKEEFIEAKRMTSACIQWGPILTSVHFLVVHHRRCQRKCGPDATLYNEIYDVSITFWFKAYFLEEKRPHHNSYQNSGAGKSCVYCSSHFPPVPRSNLGTVTSGVALVMMSLSTTEIDNYLLARSDDAISKWQRNGDRHKKNISKTKRS